jgi:hypothetical protein
MSMIRTVFVKGKEYHVITTSIEANGIVAPVQIHINISGLEQGERLLIQKHANLLLNKVHRIPKPKQQPKKPWWKVW